jgi:hypothetical protein
MLGECKCPPGLGECGLLGSHFTTGGEHLAGAGYRVASTVRVTCGGDGMSPMPAWHSWLSWPTSSSRSWVIIGPCAGQTGRSPAARKPSVICAPVRSLVWRSASARLAAQPTEVALQTGSSAARTVARDDQRRLAAARQQGCQPVRASARRLWRSAGWPRGAGGRAPASVEPISIPPTAWLRAGKHELPRGGRTFRTPIRRGPGPSRTIWQVRQVPQRSAPHRQLRRHRPDYRVPIWRASAAASSSSGTPCVEHARQIPHGCVT